MPKGGPDGGDGGRGGHIILRSNPDVDSLIALYFEPHRRAGHGGHGRGKKMHGKNGADCVIDVPLGTVARDRETMDFLGELLQPEEELLVAKGGKGGLGNVHFKSSTHQAPEETTPGELGQEITLDLELKIVADAGLVGFPNAGKSSLLTSVSHAHPKIASYPFTTINPVPGTIVFEDYTKIKIIDIPGIIHGAHDGVGLGDKFLRHIERAKLIVMVIDMAGTDGREPHADYKDLINELGQYNQELLQRPRIVLANKMDVPESSEHYETFCKETKITPIPISATSGQGLDDVKATLHQMLAPEA